MYLVGQKFRRRLGKVADLKRTYTDFSIMLYLEAVEKKVRAKAISLARGQDKMPWGLALLRALIVSASAWSSEERILVERNQKKTPQGFQNQGFSIRVKFICHRYRPRHAPTPSMQNTVQPY